MINEPLEKKSKLNFMTVVCAFAFFLSNISYLPFFTKRGLTQLLSYPAWALMIAAVVLYNRISFSRRDVKFVLMLLGFFSVLGIYTLITGKDYLGSLLTKCIFLSLVITIIGGLVAKIKATWGAENKLFAAYTLAASILCIVVFFEYLLGQDITSRLYSYGSKNETAFLAASAIVMLLYIPRTEKHAKLQMFLRIVLAAFFLYVIAGMRCRSMLLAVIVVFAVFLLQRNSSKTLKCAVILGAVVLLIALRNEEVYDKVINGVLFAGRDGDDVNDLSSGRLDQIARGMERFWQNPFVGTGDTSTVDCFFVSALMQYGLVLGTAFIFLGCYPFIWGVVNYKRIKSPVCMIMMLCALAYIIGGIFEENAPFGPGVRCYISWFLFGYLRVQQVHGYFGGKENEKN